MSLRRPPSFVGACRGADHGGPMAIRLERHPRVGVAELVGNFI
jgi:hypothetical protein